MDQIESLVIPSLVEKYHTRSDSLLKRIETLICSHYRESLDNLKQINNEEEIHSDIKEKVRSSLVNIIQQQHTMDSKYESDFAKIGLDSKKKLRHIVHLLRNGICPTPENLTLATHVEANYGSFASAELLLILTLKLKRMGYYLDGWSESLMKCFNAIIRFSPNVSLALYYFNMAKEEIPSTFNNLIPSLIYAIGLSLPENSIIEDVDIQNEQEVLISLIRHFEKIGTEYYSQNDSHKHVFESVIKTANFKINSIETTRDAFNLDNASFNEIAKDEDDLKSIFSVTSTTSTSTIDVNLSNLAYLSLELRNVSIDEVKSCLKHGDAKASKHTVKATNNQLIVFYILNRGIPYVTNVYKYLTKDQFSNQAEQEMDITSTCDSLLSSVIYEDCEGFELLCEKIIHMNDISEAEMEALTETLRILFIDALPTYDHLLHLINVIEHHTIVFPMNTSL